MKQAATRTRGGNGAKKGIEKAPTGIMGLDSVMHGGLPRGRPTLVCGGPGSGKTLLAVEFLVRGIREADEPGVFVTFEEEPESLILNAASLGFDLDDLVRRKKLWIDHIELPGKVREIGDFDLDGLFVRIGHAIEQTGATRIAIDTMENLFAGLPNRAILRAEVLRLFQWLKSKRMTAVITAEAGQGTLTRDGMEEYVSDCVLMLEQNVVNQVATRRLRIVKYRGSGHGTNLYPFVIDENGFAVIPITGASLHRGVSDQRISLGAPGMDALLGGEGPFRGSTVLVTGTAGTGKTTLAAHAADASCARGERCTFYSFEQTAGTIIRDTGELGKRLQAWVDDDLLRFEGSRPTSQGLEEHLATMRRHLRAFRPRMVVLDPISGFGSVGADWETKDMLTLFMDAIAEVDATLVMSCLTEGGAPLVSTEVGVSSLADVWILIEDGVAEGERQRLLSVVKARGTDHSKSRHLVDISDKGLQVLGRRQAGATEDDHGR